MSIWIPDIQSVRGPKYRAIAEVIASDIAEGLLTPGTKLPPHRDLAWRLNVTVGTISRAYAEAERLGLVRGEVGRGTFVLRPGLREGLPLREIRTGNDIDLSLSFPAPGDEADYIGDALSRMAADPASADLLDYQTPAGNLRHRAAGAAWLSTTGIAAAPERIVVTSGAQNGILVAFAALAQPGDHILTETLTFPGVKPVATMLGLRMEGVPVDAEGLIPEALETACRTQKSRFLYLIPTIHNPTAVVMPQARREAIAEIALRHNLTIIEDDIAARCMENPPAPIATLIPDNTVYLTSLSKTVAPGLRIGFLFSPEELHERQAAIVGASAWMAPPLAAELATNWIEGGTAERILDSRRREAVTRLDLAKSMLAGEEISATPGCHHIWLTLPDPWRGAEFTAEAKRRGVIVAPAEIFAAGRTNAPHAVRICIGMPRHRNQLQQALETLRAILQGSAMREVSMV